MQPFCTCAICIRTDYYWDQISVLKDKREVKKGKQCQELAEGESCAAAAGKSLTGCRWKTQGAWHQKQRRRRRVRSLGHGPAPLCGAAETEQMRFSLDRSRRDSTASWEEEGASSVQAG
eukprot:157931-Rhodomonas_salina.1